jgi:hypothetical protein
MPPREIAVRSAEQWCSWKERMATLAGLDVSRRAACGLPAGEARVALQRLRSLPFYFNVVGSERGPLIQSFQNFFPDRTKAIVKEAERVCAGCLRLFSELVTFAHGKVDWHMDWQTGERLPLIFYRNIAEADPSRGADLKRVWETNRQQFLVILGKAYFLTREQKYAQCAVHLIEDWIHSNPPFRGVNWKEGLEAGLRLVSWLWTLHMIADADVLFEENSQRILSSLALQRDHIERHLSLYSSPNTHLLGEVFALLVAELAFPELGHTREGVSRPLRLLEVELEKQVAEDGSDREKSAYYHCYALEMYLLATALGQQHGIAFSQQWLKRVEKMAEFLLAILRPDRSLAHFGDDDGGRAVRLRDADYYHPRSLLAVAAVLFERGDFKFAAGELPEEVFWVFGPEGGRRYLRLPEARPPQRTMWFPDAGLAVLRSDWRADATWLACQHQPMGFLTAGHSHAGLLSFELAVNGKSVIVDPGTYTYRMSSPWRDHFRRMESHNVVQIDRQCLYEPAGPFSWHGTESVHPLSPDELSPGALRVGYQARDAARREFRHVRSFVMDSPRAVTIHDHFEGTGKHRLTFWLHFAPGCRLRRTEQHEFEIQVEATTVRLVADGFGDFQWKIWEGSRDPRAGWVSPIFDHKVPAPTLWIEEEAEFPATRTMSLTVEFRPDPDVHLAPTLTQQKIQPNDE